MLTRSFSQCVPIGESSMIKWLKRIYVNLEVPKTTLERKIKQRCKEIKRRAYHHDRMYGVSNYEDRLSVVLKKPEHQGDFFKW